MIQFNIQRFGKLAKWTLVNDKKYFIKSFLQVFAILTFLFLFFTYVMSRESVRSSINAYETCSIAVVILFGVTCVVGSSFMFYSMDGKHDMQALLMLPASNFEKYLMRYASWIILLPLYLVAFFAADLFQYVFGLVVGHEEVRFVASALVDMVGDTWHKIPADKHTTIVLGITLIAIWLHSVYALGANFFRFHKNNWIPTTLIIVFLTMVAIWLIPSNVGSGKDSSLLEDIVMDTLYAFFVGLNFWLSYRLFCRRQVIGKLINV